MELEKGLKIKLDDFAAADGPFFSSRETHTMFILTSPLKGYRRGNIKIEINEDGTRIEISGEMPVQEMMKEREMRGFRKAFRIPSGVDLDKIKARLNEEESILIISMPKLVKGVIVGGGIEEVKEEGFARGVSETVKAVADEVAERKTLQKQEYGESSTEDREKSDRNVEKLSEASEFGRGKKYEDSAHEKVESAGSKVAIPKETQGEEQKKKGVPEAETTVVENQLKDDDCGTKTTESTKSVPDQAIQQPALSSPPSVEKGQAVEVRADDKIPGVESKMQIQESEKQKTSRAIQESKESKGKQEVDRNETSDMEQHKDQCQYDKNQEVAKTEENHGTENDIQEEEESESESESEKIRALEKPPQEAKVDESAKPPPKKSKLPIMAGSAFLVSLIVIVIHLIKAKNQPSNIKAKKH
ncbi:uncharacterized protein LOC132274351 [Cornus florida]|uniref:uncharacterized protein LOC132274351 n=1 Tax=Cornus florida TaxID=4283 RepID=UPI00289CD104|nr:uncharacterized protein LOC132274351 [Cornus florida]